MKTLMYHSLLILVYILTMTCSDPVSNKTLDTILLKNGIIIDGTGADPLQNQIVLIQDGIIEYLGPTNDSLIPEAAVVKDLNGAYILPGFMNTHIHSGYDPYNLKVWAQSGVTTVRDVGVFNLSPNEAFRRKENLNGNNKNARLVSAGPLVTTEGGYGNYGVSSPIDAENKVNQLIDLGADIIKIAIEDNLQGRTWPMLSMEEIRVIVNTTHSRDKKVTAHISRAKHLNMAIKCGVDDVNHMIVDSLPDSLISQMIEKDICWVPTLELWDGVRRIHGSNWDAIAKNNLRSFVEAGGTVALGTDYDGYIFEFELGMPLLEIKLMKESGMTPKQIITAATKNSAIVCDMEEKLGTIQEGKIADILIIEGNPLEDLNNLLNVKMVIHRGEIIREEP